MDRLGTSIECYDRHVEKLHVRIPNNRHLSFFAQIEFHEFQFFHNSPRCMRKFPAEKREKL